MLSRRVILPVSVSRCWASSRRKQPAKRNNNFNPAHPINTAFKMTPTTSGLQPFPVQEFDNFLVLDFEATCDENRPLEPCQEIIEFPVIQLDGKTFDEVSRFHMYVSPTIHPRLSTFCTRLTGIIQEMVDGQPTLPAVLSKFDEWMQNQRIIDSRFIFVTCGDWDLQLQLPREAAHKNIITPSYFAEWINVKKSFCDHRGHFAQGMKHLLKELSLTHTGRQHSGIDDVTNIAAITRALAAEGHVFTANGGARRNRVFGYWSKKHDAKPKEPINC